MNQPRIKCTSIFEIINRPELDVSYLEQWLQEHPQDVNRITFWELSAFQHAVDKNRLDLVSYMLQKGADLAYKDEEGETALHKALKVGNPALTEALIDAGSPLDAKDNHRKWPLLQAIQSQQFQSALHMIRAGASIEITDKMDRSALYWATVAGSAEVVRALVEHGAITELIAPHAFDEGLGVFSITRVKNYAFTGIASYLEEVRLAHVEKQELEALAESQKTNKSHGNVNGSTPFTSEDTPDNPAVTAHRL